MKVISQETRDKIRQARLGKPHQHTSGRRDVPLYENGYLVIRFWGREIQKDARLCAQIVIAKLLMVIKN